MTDGERWARELLAELRSAGYRPRAWARFLARSFERASERRHERVLAITVAQFVVWATLLTVCTYLLMVVIDDVATSLFQRDSRVGRTLRHGMGVGSSAIDQFGVLLSAMLRLAILVIALGLLLYPFGAGFGSFLDRVGGLARGVEVGGVAISPGTILRFIAVLALGLFLVRQFTGWLDQRYLPSTDLDNSVRNSIRLVARYLAIALAVVWALASLDRKSTRLNSSHIQKSRMPSSA